MPARVSPDAQTVPTVRLRELASRPPRRAGEFVVYLMTAYRRHSSNFTLQHTRDIARVLDRPLLVLECLSVDHPWASERLHRFVLDGMADNRDAFASRSASYAAFVERRPGDIRGLIEALDARACAMVTDDQPGSFLLREFEALTARLHVPLVAVDGNGLLPLRRARRAYPTARGFRRLIQEQAAESLEHTPEPDPLRGVQLRSLPELPAFPRERWPVLADDQLAAPMDLIGALPVDQRVRSAGVPGGSRAAHARLRAFISSDLARYGKGRNHPDDDVASRLSPYLHFGHISTHEVLSGIGLRGSRFALRNLGKREGFWGLPQSSEAFLEELLTWRELAFNGAALLPAYNQYRSLPAWARTTLARHAGDPRPELYSHAQLESAETSDPIWNAAQRQLTREGSIHNYLRMLWGKRILEWSEGPEQAFATMVELNNRYALDGCGPSSYAGIAWVLGRYDRAWGPERAIFGTVRYMSSASTQRKLRLRSYLDRHAA